MKNAEKWVQPTKFTGDWPDWNGFTFLEWDKNHKVYHPGDDYNLGYGDQDLGQDVNLVSNGIIVHTSKRSTGYGNMITAKHTLGYNLKRFIKEAYGIDTNELYTLYAHLKDIFVNVGDEIDAGSRIGTVGKSGTKWAHLHHEIFAPIGELNGKSWRFYPVGWPKEKVKEYWLPAYQFIESTKNIESYENFLGRPKDYWLQIEKDREDLMLQLGEADKMWAKKLENAEKDNEQSLVESAEKLVECKTSLGSSKNAVKKLTGNIEILKNQLIKLKSENVNLLKGHAKKVSFLSALKIVVFNIGEILGKGVNKK